MLARAIAMTVLVGCWTGSTSTPAPSPAQRPPSPRELALDWVQALLTNDPAQAEQLSAVPFSFDRRRIDATTDLRTALDKAAAKASSRPHAIAGAEIVVRGDLSAHFAVPVAGRVGVRVTVGREGILVLVQPDPPRVVGFRD
jgi:hypothetical protein